MQAEVAMAGIHYGFYWGAVIALIGYAIGKGVQLFYKMILKGGD